MNAQSFDIHQLITDQIVEAIEAGVGEFKLPWHRPGHDLLCPRNVASNVAYRGVNILTLWLTAQSKGFTSGIWGTFNQWAAVGANVRKGEKAAHVIFYKEINVGDEEDETKKRLFARATPVFAAEQAEGYDLASLSHQAGAGFKSSAEIDAFIGRTGAMLHHGGHQAYYQPSTDSIHLPFRETFLQTATSSPEENYYSTLFHELTHNAAIQIMPHLPGGGRFAILLR